MRYRLVKNAVVYKIYKHAYFYLYLIFYYYFIFDIVLSNMILRNIDYDE